MKEKQKRTLTLPASLYLREAGEEGAESRTLEGYALKFGVRSLLIGYYYPFYEVLEPGCITEEMLREQDIKFTMFHDRTAILGRYNKGAGTLKLTLDEVGLHVECEMPHTADGDKALELVKRGDLSGMSFIYWTDEDDSENCVSYEPTDEKTDYGKVIYLRHVKKILGMEDVTIASNPAYTDTEIASREQRVRDFAEAHSESTARQERAAAETLRREREADAAFREKELRDIASALQE